MSTESILRVEGLSIAYRVRGAWLDAVRDVSLRVEAGQTVGLVGESGSGKTTLALAIVRYLGPNGAVRAGTIEFAGRDWLAQPESEVRGASLSLVPQDPSTALNPSMRVGEQLAEVFRHRLGLGKAGAQSRAIEWLHTVRTPDPARVAESYPHQLSGGLQQRVLIALALSAGPRLVVLDEPTTNLDATTQAAMLGLLRDLIGERGTAALYVTHNLGVVARICDRVAVLYAGELVEEAATVDVFRQPLHPYTRGLLDSVPRLGQRGRIAPLRGIDGQIPLLGQQPSGCVFAPRCPLAIDRCHVERPALDEVTDDRRVRCHRWREILSGVIDARLPMPVTSAAHSDAGNAIEVLNVHDLTVRYSLRRSVADALTGRPPRGVNAVDGVSLSIARGRTLGVVGESGAGKTTLARAVAGLVSSVGGEVELLGVALPPTLTQRSRETLRHLQMVFQNPDEALNPHLTIGETLSRPLLLLAGVPHERVRDEVARLLAAVRLPASYADRLPAQLSGGEKQRVAIARALVSDPDLLIADEPVSALDVSVQASILNLLRDLQVERGSALVFISHDLAVVGYLADVIAVMVAGQLVEIAPSGDLFAPPYHPYTEVLLSAIPIPDPEARPDTIRLEGESPGQSAASRGCPFYSRCPRVLGDVCANETPPWQVTENGKRIFCHIPLEELKASQGRRAERDA
jgi:peptide/nickel transport system ATP-binding protein